MILTCKTKEREGRKQPPKKMIGYRVFPDVNKICRPKAMTPIPILLGNYRLIQYETFLKTGLCAYLPSS